MLLRFGPNELNASSFELRRSRRRIRLATRPMELLLLLVQRRGELVTREEIARSLWPGLDVEDLAARINTAIAQIRGALDEDASRPKYLETVIGKGYRFIAAVEEIPMTVLAPPGQDHEGGGPQKSLGGFSKRYLQQEPAAAVGLLSPVEPSAAPLPEPLAALPAELSAAPPQTARGRRLTGLLIALTALAVLAAGALLYFTHARPRSSAPVTWADRQVTENDRDMPVNAAALSPDGRSLAYADSGGVFIQDLATGQTRQVQSPPMRAVRLAWFPEQKSLLLTGYAPAQNQSQIWILSPASGPPRLFRQSGQDAVPSPNGASIAFLAEAGREIRVADLNGAGERTIAKAAAAGTYSALFWSANSQRINYQQRALSPNGSIEMESNYEWTYGSREVATGTQTAFLANLAFDSAQESSDGRMFFLRARSGAAHDNYGIWMVKTDPVSGRLLDSPKRLWTLPLVVINGLTVSADGRQVAATREARQPDIYAGETDSPVTGLRQVKRITSNLRNDYPHSWDAKSQVVYFESDRAAGGRFHVFRQPIDSPTAEMLTRGDDGQFFPAITENGNVLVYERWRRKGAQDERLIERADPDGTHPRLVWKEGDLDEWRCPTRTLASCVLRETQRHEQFVFYRLDLSTGKGEELARCAWMPSVVQDWSLSSDGSEAAIPSHDKESPAILLVPLRGQGTAHMLKVKQESQLWGIHFAADDSGFFAEARSETEHELEFIDRAGSVHPLRATDGNTWGVPAPDGKKLAFVDGTTNRNVFIWQP